MAVGDALGCPVEGLKGGHIQQLYGKVKDYVDPLVAWKKKPHRWRLPGLYSDDTQQALALADTLVTCHGFEPKYFAGLLVSMFEVQGPTGFGAHRGTGTNFRSSVRRLVDGAKPLEAGMPTAGIGAAMRVAPVGLYYQDDEPGLLKAAVEQSLVTHRDPRALALACGVAYIIARGASGSWDGTTEKERMEQFIAFIEQAEGYIEREYIHLIDITCSDFFREVAKAVKGFPYLLELDRRQVWKQIVMEANRHFPKQKLSEPAHGFALAGGVTAMFLGLAGKIFSDSVIEVISLGKDTDTMGALVGSMLGARLGEQDIPPEWIKGLVNADQVRMRGEALSQRSAQGLALTNLVKMETELTLREQQARQELIEKLTRRGDIPSERGTPPKKEKKPKTEPMVTRDRRGKKIKRRREKAPWKRYEEE